MKITPDQIKEMKQFYTGRYCEIVYFARIFKFSINQVAYALNYNGFKEYHHNYYRKHKKQKS